MLVLKRYNHTSLSSSTSSERLFNGWANQCREGDGGPRTYSLEIALLHYNSPECSMTCQTQLVYRNYAYCQPSRTLPIEIFLGKYTDLRNILPQLRMQITSGDGKSLAQDVWVVINYTLNTFFLQVDLTLGDRSLSQSSTTHPGVWLGPCWTFQMILRKVYL